MSTVEQQIEMLAHLFRNAPRFDVVLMQQGTQIAVLAGRYVPSQQQGGNSVEARIVEPVHAGVGVACLQEKYGFLKSLPGTLQPVGDKGLLLRGHRHTPSRSTFS